jgi:ABC-type transport system involved in multi-copper enzyme maturation permease subunit
VTVWISARAQASGKGISTTAWSSAGALGAALSDYGIVLLWITGYAVLALLIAVTLRSVPLALGVGIAWAGPIEHLIRNAWPTAQKIFPGLSLEVLGQRGTPDVTMTHASVVVLAYIIIASAIAAATFSRRDVSA